MNAQVTPSWNIELAGLRLGYGEHIVLDDLNATLPGGKISVILGGSGCGKSTLLRHIIGLKRPLAGKILLAGKDLFALPGRSFRRVRRRMGVLFQDGALLGSLTLGENVGLPLREHTALSQAVIAEVVRHKLSLVGLADFYDFYPHELSGGMRKRAGLARALVTDPPLLLCDEPTSGLDPINAALMDALLLDLKAQNPDMSVIVVSHDLNSLEAIADHVLVLNEGRAAFNGSKEELRNTGDAYLRSFLDRRPPGLGDAAKSRELSPQVRAKVQESLDSWLDN